MAVYTAQLELANAECEAGIRPAFARRASARHGLLFGLLMRQQILAFAAITIPLVITPGIATTLVLRTSLLHGVAAGLVIAGGAALASASYGVLSGLSTTLVVERWPGALLVLEFGGSAFLVWLEGHAIWRALGPEDAVPRMAACGGVGQGFLANALNPPVALFYFLVVPRFVPAGAPLFRSVMILTMVHVGLAFTWHASCAAAAGAFSRFLSSRTARRGIDLVTGLVLIAFAINMLLSPKWRGREPATGQPFHTNAISSTATPPRFGLSVVVSSGSVAALYSASSAATSAASSVSSRASLSFSSCTVPVARATS